MKKKNFIIVLSTLITLLLIFTACGGGGGSGTDDLFKDLYETFETGDLSKYDWVTGKSEIEIAAFFGLDGDYFSPVIQSNETYEGDYALEFKGSQSDTLNISTLSLDLALEEDSVLSFYKKVVGTSYIEKYLKQEQSSGFGLFLIDRIQEKIMVLGRWLGKSDWTQVIRELPAGDYTLVWLYSKDGQNSNDAVYIDNVIIDPSISLGEPVNIADTNFKNELLRNIGKIGYDIESSSRQTSSPLSALNGFRGYNIENNRSDTPRKTSDFVRYTSDEIYTNELKDMDYLDIWGPDDELSSVYGIQNCENLQYLDISSRGISDISPITDLKEIKLLSLNTGIDNITALTHLSQLEWLWLANDNANDITPIHQLENLQVLYVFQPISSDSLEMIKEMTFLKALYLSNVGVTTPDIDFISNFDEIIFLDLYGMGINDISGLSSNNTLQSLSLSDNNVSDISPLENLTNLRQLNLRSNNVSDISPLENLYNLEVLRLSFNSINNINHIENLIDMKKLYLRHSSITDISTLENLIRLEVLDLYSNNISDISPLANLTKLEDLNFSGNNVSNINALTNLINLEQLHFGSNSVSNITPIQNMNNLWDLSFGHNQVTDLSPLITNSSDWEAPLPFSLVAGIYMRYNNLDLTPGSQNMDDINTLIDRGINVEYVPQN